MACFSPITAWQTDDGQIVFAERGKIRRELTLPCGQCIGCRLERSRVWATRVMHEASLYDSNYFVTLTYDDNNLPCPPSVNYRDFQLFMKKLRKQYPGVRFYMCAEYGEETKRPHYHACLFNIRLPDLIVYSSSGDEELYISNTLDKIWGKGLCTIGQLTHESAAYVSRYCMKKVTGNNADLHYQWLDLTSGEWFDALPEFNKMSLKPGIGTGWIEKWASDVFNHDHLIVKGKKTRPGRFYDKYREKVDPLGLESVKYDRYLKAQELGDQYSPARLQAKAEIARAKLRLKKRSLC